MSIGKIPRIFGKLKNLRHLFLILQGKCKWEIENISLTKTIILSNLLIFIIKNKVLSKVIIITNLLFSNNFLHSNFKW